MDTRVAAYAVIEDERGLLLSHWRRGRLHGWTLPGGGLDAGESPRDACVREVWEETGYRVRLGALLGVDSRVLVREEPEAGQAAELHTIRIVYSAEVIGGELTAEIDGSSDDAAWFSAAEVAGLKRLSLVDTALAMRAEPGRF